MGEKSVAEMTGEDFRRLARESGELADRMMWGDKAYAERVKRLASALCEADARLQRVLDALDPLDPTVPEAVIDVAVLNVGGDPEAIAARGAAIAQRAKALRGEAEPPT